MIPQEVINNLKKLKSFHNGSYGAAINFAIKALEQQPCDDAISRESVRKLICQNNDKYGYSDRFHEFTERCLQLPSVTPEPCEDCISREDALKAIEEQKKGFYGVERYAIDECHSAVMKLPSVRPHREIVEDKRACEKCIHYVTRDSRGKDIPTIIEGSESE